MKIYKLHGVMDIRSEEVAMPKCSQGEVLVHTEFCGICGSDLPRVFKGIVPYLPTTLGHEFSATVVEVGEGVKTVSPGDLVAVLPLLVCHQCENCKNGNFGQCVSSRFLGLRVPDMGGFAEYNVLPKANVLKLPKEIDPMLAAFIEPASVALHGLSQLGIKPGRDIAIVGVGTIGQLAIQAAKAMGAKTIFAFDINDEKLSLAKKMGADKCYNTNDKDFLEKFMADTNGLGCPQVVQAVGIEATVLICLDICSVGGDVAIIGEMHEDVTFSPQYFYRKFSFKQLTLHGVYMSYSLNYPGIEWRLAAHYIANGLIDPKPLIYKVAPMKKINEAFEDYKIAGAAAGKLLVTFNDL